MPNEKTMSAIQHADKLETYILSLAYNGSIVPPGYLTKVIAEELEVFAAEKVQERINWEYGAEAVKRVRQEEREACAKIADSHFENCETPNTDCAGSIADDIRYRARSRQ